MPYSSAQVSEQLGTAASSAGSVPPAGTPSRFQRLLLHGSAAGADAALLVLRVAFGLALASAHGYGKVANSERFLEGLATKNFPLPGFFGWAAIASEFLGGLLLALGLLTRPAAAFVLITLGVAAFGIHAHDPFAKRELALAYAVVALAVLLAGPGRFSLDRRLFRAH